jgi:hypothetical protein
LKAGEAENPKSRLGDTSGAGPHVVMGKRRDSGGVCKAERVAAVLALDALLKERSTFEPKLLVLLCALLGMPIAGDAEGVKW